jgi:L-alanine-DL-glutamate epimerase-like enolase superfamily enzyme
MKISAIRPVGLQMPVKHVALLQVETDAGLVGIGSTSAPIGVIAALIEDIEPLLLGRDPTDPTGLWRLMFEGWQAQRGRGGEGGVAVNAMAAIDMALWDLTGKAQDKAIHQLLGGAIQDRIMAYASATAYDYTGSLAAGKRIFKSTEKLVAECHAYLAQGFKAIKFGWGNRFGGEQIEQIGAMRQAVGPEVHLMLDFGCPAYNGDGWTVDTAIEVVNKLEPFRLFFFEEALQPYDVAGFAALKAASSTPIATGESLVTLTDFDHFIQRKAVDVLQADAQQIGITVFDEVARRAEATDILCIPHCPWTALAFAAHLQVLSVRRNCPMIEYIALAGFAGVPFLEPLQYGMTTRIVETPPVFEDGYLLLNERPGLGLGQFVMEAIAEVDALEPIEFP